MTIHELLGRFTPAEIRFQVLDEAIAGATTSKQGQTQVRFWTAAISATGIVQETGPVGLVVWLPRERWNELAAERKG